ncbi:glycosyltransferase family 2 protein [Bradyrhizobium elkanii]|uniref:glycosyltransferase family 2 protein n=1 Tax=Bradyrhizobium elkanii TaxID=29448 RepID=UPI003D1DF66C
MLDHTSPSGLELVSRSETKPKVAVLVPCYNEQSTVAEVVSGFRRALPASTIYVYDNNSSDQTAAVAAKAGAIVRRERLQGKGNVVRRMLSDVEADVYIMIDGDATYDPGVATEVVDLIANQGMDFVNVRRVSSQQQAYRRGHRLGNLLLTSSVAWVFGRYFTDMLSGYKAFSKRFAKSFPALSSGFETETEITIHALELRAPSAEISAAYGARPEGSASKLRTFRDGARILGVIARIVSTERPLMVFSLFAALLAVIAIALGIPLVIGFVETGFVERIPTAIIICALGVGSMLSLFSGVILNMVTISRREMKRLFYLRS